MTRAQIGTRGRVRTCAYVHACEHVPLRVCGKAYACARDRAYFVRRASWRDVIHAREVIA
eukprot:939724-Pleurochrysis_carterae.AAC.6